jgi:hypothetical protein
MNPLIISASAESPSVIFNGESGSFVVSGKSYPENVNDFYKPLFEYLDLYKKAPKDKTILEFNWIYFNTATSKIIMKLILNLKEFKGLNKSVEVRWCCKSTDELMIEKGEEIKELIDIDFKIIYEG